MTYDTEVAADSPWGYWKQEEASGNLVDSSGNSRTMTVTGTPTYAQAGPVGGVNAILWGNVASQRGETTATSAAGVFTHEIWVYLTGNPAARTTIIGRATAYGTTGAADGELYIEPDGKVGFHVFSGSHQTVTSASALTLSAWHHVTASVGAAGMRVRVDKSTVASNAGVTSGYTGSAQKIFIRGGGSGYNGTGVVTLARGSTYTTQLSTTRLDAHYDAMFAAGSAIDGSLAVILPMPQVAFTGSYTIGTDTSNGMAGLRLGGYVMNEAPDPVMPTPPAIWTPPRSDDMALYLPPPTIVDGRIQ